MGVQYPGSRYNLLGCNCNHFTTELALQLGVQQPIPAWVNRLAAIGACFAGLLPRSLVGDAPVTGGDRSVTSRNPLTAKPAAFTGIGHSLRGTADGETAPLLGANDTADRETKRE